MLVSELIEELKKMPPDTQVCVFDNEFGAMGASDVRFVKDGEKYRYEKSRGDMCIIDS